MTIDVAEADDRAATMIDTKIETFALACETELAENDRSVGAVKEMDV